MIIVGVYTVSSGQYPHWTQTFFGEERGGGWGGGGGRYMNAHLGFHNFKKEKWIIVGVWFGRYVL